MGRKLEWILVGLLAGLGSAQVPLASCQSVRLSGGLGFHAIPLGRLRVTSDPFESRNGFAVSLPLYERKVGAFDFGLDVRRRGRPRDGSGLGDRPVLIGRIGTHWAGDWWADLMFHEDPIMDGAVFRAFLRHEFPLRRTKALYERPVRTVVSAPER